MNLSHKLPLTNYQISLIVINLKYKMQFKLSLLPCLLPLVIAQQISTNCDQTSDSATCKLSFATPDFNIYFQKALIFAIAGGESTEPSSSARKSGIQSMLSQIKITMDQCTYAIVGFQASLRNCIGSDNSRIQFCRKTVTLKQVEWDGANAGMAAQLLNDPKFFTAMPYKPIVFGQYFGSYTRKDRQPSHVKQVSGIGSLIGLTDNTVAALEKRVHAFNTIYRVIAKFEFSMAVANYMMSQSS